MASNYKRLKCDSCAGSLEYDRERKVWVCQYCGNQIRREEEYDGLYTIKNVVKQTIIDLAYNRLDSAQKNLIECEKIDSSYVGTIIAKLCLQMFQLITPGACPDGTSKALLAQMKRSYQSLQEIDAGVSAQEEALYEALENADDALGVLILVFDSLGAAAHLEFVEKFLQAENIYSVSLNEKLLHYAMKNGKRELEEKILHNTDNIDCHRAFFQVLKTYPDGEEKRGHIKSLAAGTALAPEERKEIEAYLIESQDALETKITVYQSAFASGVTAALQCVEETILSRGLSSPQPAESLMETVIKSRPKDAELNGLIEKIYSEHEGGMAGKEMTMIAEGGLFYIVPVRIVTGMLCREDLTTEEKLHLLKLAENKEMSQKNNDAILAAYLSENRSPMEERLEVLEELLRHVQAVATTTLENYVLYCSQDGAGKCEIVERLFSLDLNLSFFRDLLKNYLKRSADNEDVRERIVEILVSKGLTVDASSLLDYACEGKLELVRTMLAKGMSVRSDTLSAYLERAEVIEPEYLSLFHKPDSIISEKALCNYVLYGREAQGTKAPNALVFSEKTAGAFGHQTCTVLHLNNRITCNLFQAYTLIARDSEETVRTLVNAMKNAEAKLNPSIRVNENSMKFKRYIVDHKECLGDMTRKICEENNVFSLLFL